MRNKTWIWVLWLEDNVLNVSDGVAMPDNALPRTNKEKGARDSKARVHNQKGDSKDLQSRDPIVLGKDSKMGKWDLGDLKGDLKDLSYVLNVASPATNRLTVEWGSMKHLSNLFLL